MNKHLFAADCILVTVFHVAAVSLWVAYAIKGGIGF